MTMTRPLSRKQDNTHNPVILIVEDDIYTSEMLSDILSDFYTIETVDNGNDVLERFDAPNFDLLRG